MSDPVIVTGSDSGIGRASAIALARRGHDVGVTWHTDEAGAQDTAASVGRIGPRAVVRRLDLTHRPDQASTSWRPRSGASGGS